MVKTLTSDSYQIRSLRSLTAQPGVTSNETMIDRASRNKLAEVIRHFIGRFKDNFEYDDAAFDINTKDKGVIEIRDNVWLIYDDLKRHKMEGKWALSKKQDTIVKRCIVFLKSDYEYRWPKLPLYYKVTRPFVWLISFGIITRKLDNYFNGNGSLDVWPFFTENEYVSAKNNPSYCAKST